MAESEKIAIPVKIFNQELRIRTDEPPEYVREVARYLDSKIFEVVNSASATSPTKAVILAALNITDELFREREKYRELFEKVKSQTEIIGQKLAEIEA
ncbi:cell division protein ZapA [bacterium]|nr:cell division protein ZapA [bacterium]